MQQEGMEARWLSTLGCQPLYPHMDGPMGYPCETHQLFPPTLQSQKHKAPKVFSMIAVLVRFQPYVKTLMVYLDARPVSAAILNGDSRQLPSLQAPELEISYYSHVSWFDYLQATMASC
jgi:hypothetical protein